MPKGNVIIFVILTCLLSDLAQATKCLRAQSVAELEQDFPVVIQGKIISKKPLRGAENSYSVEIEVTKYLKGNLDKKKLSTTETQYHPLEKEAYQEGKEYIFPVELKKQGKDYEVIIPQDGCPKYNVEQ